MREHFDSTGRFRLRLPDDFLRFAEFADAREDVEIGDDALGHARRLAEDAVRAVRAVDIGGQIRAGGGRLPEIRARLHPYQIEGVAFLAGRGRGLLADDMGLGKTLQAIAAAQWMHRHDGVERVLIVCPASLKLQWAREIERFTGARVQIVQGPMEARGTQYRRGPGFYVVNYELVMRDLTVINRELCPDLLILDEAQRIKNWRTKIASAVKRIGSRYAFVLTGTPLENRLEDLYSLMQVVDPRILGPLWRYMVDFHITDERGKILGYRNLSQLRQRLSGVMLRRDRSLVRDQLPERIVQRIDVPMSEAQEEIHDAAIKTAGHIAQIMRRRPLTPSEQNRMMAALQQARMACDAAGLVDKETEGAPKLDELEALLDELCRSGGLKAVVFSQWERMTEMVEQRVRRLGLGAVRLHGGVPTHKRGALMDRFREDDAVQVFISTDAGGVGLNLQNAAVLINLDIPWNPAVLDQRIARVHRLGQQQKVQAILLVAPASYEERVLALVQGKRNLFDNVVDPDATDDVVGVSRRLAEILAEDLRAPEPGERDQPQGTAAAESEASPEQAGPKAMTKSAASDPEAQEGPDVEQTVRRCITALQQKFGPRIERILGQRGSGDGESKAGLVLVLDQVDAHDDEAIEALAAEIPVALIDQRTLMSLNRLGSASPLAGAESVYATASTNTPQEPESPLARKAVRNLEAAGLLLQQSCPAPALDLLLDALLAAAALLAGRADPPTVQQAGVWLYGEALPTGRITPADAGLLMQAIALAQAGDTIPADLLHRLMDDAHALIHSATPGSDQGK